MANVIATIIILQIDKSKQNLNGDPYVISYAPQQLIYAAKIKTALIQVPGFGPICLSTLNDKYPFKELYLN